MSLYSSFTKDMSAFMRDIAVDDAHYKRIATAWNKNMKPKFGYGLTKGSTSSSASAPPAVVCENGRCHRPSTTPAAPPPPPPIDVAAIAQEVHPRPRGRAPSGCTWDGANGQWVTIDPFRAARSSSSSKPRSRSSKPRSSSSSKPRSGSRTVGCRHRFVRGARAGHLCNKPQSADSDYCSAHKAAHVHDDSADSDSYDSYDSYDSDPYDSESCSSGSDDE